MHKEQIVGLAVRLFAIFLGFYTLRHASSLLPYVLAPPPNNISLMFAGAVVLPPILAAVLMWYFPLALANKLIPDIKTKDAPASIGCRWHRGRSILNYGSLGPNKRDPGHVPLGYIRLSG